MKLPEFTIRLFLTNKLSPIIFHRETKWAWKPLFLKASVLRFKQLGVGSLAIMAYDAIVNFEQKAVIYNPNLHQYVFRSCTQGKCHGRNLYFRLYWYGAPYNSRGKQFDVSIKKRRLNEMDQALGNLSRSDQGSEKDLSKWRLSKFKSICSETAVSEI